MSDAHIYDGKKIPWKSGARGAHSRGLRQDSWARSLVKRKRAKAVQLQPTAQTETHGSLTRHAKMRRGKSRQGKARQARAPCAPQEARSAHINIKMGVALWRRHRVVIGREWRRGGSAVLLCFYVFKKKKKKKAKFYFASVGF